MRDQTTIYFIRHGETDWNRDRRYQGQRDIPLNDTGRAQARRNGIALRTYLPAMADADFVASPLGRTRETMEIVRGELGLAPAGYAIDPRLLELSYGLWEGTLQDDVADRDPDGLAARRMDPYRWRPDRGESYADLFARVSGWAETVRRDCVVVSHGGVSRCLRALVLGLDPGLIPGGAMRWL
jgi:probable phosphoglycerate mutase